MDILYLIITVIAIIVAHATLEASSVNKTSSQKGPQPEIVDPERGRCIKIMWAAQAKARIWVGIYWDKKGET